ncbi:hypothetical protein K402DRAFT_156614 [Aulographum hederae CBS 113979]|uniref:Uncharacterized protein n=1 Tax=Aulographum hederae CBS 113979 TaxID=1176131 RepID=A0A6G1GSN6_9PEZI|nr:hypothetical protein K402DRAFT_156614 [Aulographum hederae CBS 113979]
MDVPRHVHFYTRLRLFYFAHSPPSTAFPSFSSALSFSLYAIISTGLLSLVSITKMQQVPRSPNSCVWVDVHTRLSVPRVGMSRLLNGRPRNCFPAAVGRRYAAYTHLHEPCRVQ